MAVTGLALFGFVVIHLLGNLLIFQGPEALNGYSAKLHAFGPLLWLAEIGLAALVLLHAYSGIRVRIENRRARPSRYVVNKSVGEASIASRTMAIGGILIAVFLVIHVRMFRFGGAETHENGLWGLVIEQFQNPLVVGFYVVAMAAVGLHLAHGLASAFQTLGALKPHWRARLRHAGMGVGWLIALGFAIFPVWAYLYR